MMKYGGATLEALAQHAGKGFKATVETAGKSIKAIYPQTIEAKIQGTTAHRSSKDPSGSKEVITISYHTGKGSRLLSIHAHDNGTWNEFFSRARKNAGGGESSSSSSAQGTTTTDLTWRTNDQTKCAEWWDGTK
ncbi:hypothetical protein BKA65DRAFT_486084 [Rhexocercosporidium sp. MPI-PUGE-AT-0058]|nr:hypothetical protein BKA65DRAFT_486084 [Rhexocercosporidium sp. MPI-PUGE-AT-0058]